MNMISRAAVVMIGMTGLAAAQPRTEAKPADAQPPAELAELAKATAGTWRCKGQGMDHSQKLVDMTATMKIKLDVANWWIHSSFDARMGREPFEFESFTSFDPKTRSWKRVMVESGGTWSSGESVGTGATMKDDKKVDWELATHSPTMGDGMFRDHEDMSDAKAGARTWGEFSPDKGKTWIKIYEMTCKK